MEYLSDQLKRTVAETIIRENRVFFFLDYDGTLAPIMPIPSLAQMGDSTRAVLKDLIAAPGFSVGIITGRKLDEIRSLVRLDGLIYAGNNGLELKGPDFSYTHAKTQAFHRTFDEIRPALEPLTALFPGSFVEDKGVGLTFHYRLVKEEKLSNLRMEFLKWMSPWIDGKKVSLLEAKKAFEIRPGFNWNKGSAVRWILLRQEPESYPIFIGDDKTDEYAFRALADRGMTIRVGEDQKSSARYYLKDPLEVERFLAFLAGTKQAEGRSTHAAN